MSNKARNLPDQFRHCSNLMRRMYHQNDPMNTRHGQGKLLNYLLVMDGSNEQDLINEMRMRPGSFKEVLKQAEINGFVSCEDKGDSETVDVFITDEARGIAEKRAAANNAVADEIFAEFSAEERAQFEQMLDKLCSSLEKKTQSGDNEFRRSYHRSRRSRRYDGHRRMGGRRLSKKHQYASRA